jgi:hypothetical protein
MTLPRILVLLGSAHPIVAPDGSAWRAVDGEPAFRRVILTDDTNDIDVTAYGEGVSVWVGEQMDDLVETGDVRDATALLTVGQEPASGHEPEFNEWMDTEHVPGLSAVDGCVSGHRYRSISSEPGYFAVYHLRDLTVNTTPEWKSVGASPLSAQMKPHARKRTRGLYVADPS